MINSFPKSTISVSDLSAVDKNFGLIIKKSEFDFEEHKRQTHNERKKFLQDLLDILDSFERLFLNINNKRDKITSQMKKWIGNFRTVHKMLQRLLEQEGVTKIQNR